MQFGMFYEIQIPKMNIRRMAYKLARSARSMAYGFCHKL